MRLFFILTKFKWKEELIMAKKYTYTEVKHFIEIESKSGCLLISKEYKNCGEKLLLKCKCGNEFQTSFNSFKFNNKKQCNKCGMKSFINKQTKTNKEFIKEVSNIVGDEYIFLETYKGVPNKILCMHNKCGHQFYVRPNHFLRGSRCPKCYGCLGVPPKTHEQFLYECHQLVGDEYYVLETYVNARTPILLRHDECGHEYYVTPDKFLSGRRCPECMGSNGEKVIREHLERIGKIYKKEYSFEGLVGIGGGLLRFDFAIFNNDNLISLIEYDGEQHFKFIDGMMTQDDYETLQIHDECKNQYCKDNNIPLLRIPYWKFDNIEEILTNYL